MDTSRIATAANATHEPGVHPARADLPTLHSLAPATIVTSTDAQAARIAELSAELAAADETARQHIARELHDGLGADLTGVRFAFANLDTWLPEDAPDGCRRALAFAQQALDAALVSYRRALDEVSPALEAGLVSTLSGWVAAFGARSGLRTSVVCAADARLAQLKGDGALGALRVAQEALANVAKHARASAADVRLEADATHLELIVADDGAGLQATTDAADAGGRGLRHMQARCTALGGTLSIAPRAHGGTELRARFAWARLAAASQAESQPLSPHRPAVAARARSN